MAESYSKKIVTTDDVGDWRIVASGLTGGSATYAFATAPGTDVPVALWSANAGSSQLDGTGKEFAVLEVLHPGGAAAFNYTLTVFGFATMPAAFAYANYRYAADVVVSEKQIARASTLNGAGQSTFLHAYPYYLFVISSTTVAPGGNTKFRLRFVRRGDSVG